MKILGPNLKHSTTSSEVSTSTAIDMHPVWISATNLLRWKNLGLSSAEENGEKITGTIFVNILWLLEIPYNYTGLYIHTCTKLTAFENLISSISLQASDMIISLAADPKLQQFLDNIPKKESMEDKAIYQPGCVRKVNRLFLLSSCTIMKHQGMNF